MRSRKAFAALSAGVVILLACADSTGPPGRWPESEAAGSPELHTLRWDAPAPLQLAVQKSGGEGVVFAPAALPSLDRYEVGFWATRGQAAVVEINYRSATGNWLPFLTLALDPTSLHTRPTGELFRSGDKVFITVRVDSVQMRVFISPGGLKFSPDSPTRLAVWYTGADPDLNGDGRIDALDAEIERELLDLWTQQTQDDPWVPLEAKHLIDSKQFEFDLSGYAVSFSGYAVSY